MPTPRLAVLPVLALTLILGCSGSDQTGTGASTGSTSSSTTGSGGTGGVGGSVGGGGGATSCPACEAPEAIGTLGDGALAEISGVVASLAHPGVFWAHNDSGDSPRIFAVDAAGTRLATITIAGADAIDWEDIARGPCPAGTCLYLADIGDNPLQRSSYTIYRIPEPATIADATVTAEPLPFTYPDGSHNAETLLVHPTTGAITVVTKVFVAESSIFELPLPLTPGMPAVMKLAGKIKPPSGSVFFTGGDVHPSGTGVLLRTYSALHYYPISPEGTVADALTGAPCAVPVASETQGEAVGWLDDGMGYVTIGEGSGAKVNRVACGGF